MIYPSGQKLVYQFTVQRYLASGAFSDVYEVFDVEAERDCILKVLHGRNAAPAQAEIRTLIKLPEHENFVPLLSYGKLTENDYYLVFPYEHDSLVLSDYLKSTTLSPLEAKTLLFQLATVLAHAHERHIYHLDVKPSNVLIADSQNLQSGGFPLFKLFDFNASTGIAGSPEYWPHDFSDEDLIEDIPAGDFNSIAKATAAELSRIRRVKADLDLYALGVTFFQALTGASVSDVSEDFIHDFPAVFSAYPQAAEFDDAYKELLAKLLAVKRRNRYSQAKELLSDLKALPVQRTTTMVDNKIASMLADFESKISSVHFDSFQIHDQCNRLQDEMNQVLRDGLTNLNRLEQNEYGDEFDAIYDVVDDKLKAFDKRVSAYLEYKREKYLTRDFDAYRTHCLDRANQLLDSMIQKNMHLPLKVILNREPSCLQMLPATFFDRYAESAWLMMQDICMSAIKRNQHIYLFLLDDDWAGLQQTIQKEKKNFLLSLEEQFTQRQSALGTDVEEAMPSLRAWVVDRSIMPVPFPVIGDVTDTVSEADDVVSLDIDS